MFNEPVKINEVIEAFKALGGTAKSKQIQDYIISSRGNILPKTYQLGGWRSYRNTIQQVIQVHCPGHIKYRNEQHFEELSKGLFKLVGFNESDHQSIIESGQILTSEMARKSKIDKKSYDRIVEENKIIGDKGELLVMDHENKRLASLGRKDLADQIRHVALESTSEGYDIMSFDELGNKIFIEVKSSKTENNSFYITDNEYTVAKELRKSYWIYRVLNCNSNFKIITIQDPFGLVESGRWKMRPISYAVTCT
ncbi:MAG: DUF3883 domain-containing protein [Sedimentisphaerales bacterium]|jgi:hypothetical protein